MDSCKAPGELVGDGHMHFLAKKWRIDISSKCICLQVGLHGHLLITDLNYRTCNEIHYFMVI